jgi:cell wall-associated NlpC family hydrolase
MLRYEHLTGIRWDWMGAHCYALVRRFFADNYGIGLRDYACPAGWWNHGLSLFTEFYHREGFTILDCPPYEYREGDVVLMAIRAPVANHLGVFVERGRMLHHLVGGLSKLDAYAGLWRETCVGVVRHRDIAPPAEKRLDMMRLIPNGLANSRTSDDPQR